MDSAFFQPIVEYFSGITIIRVIDILLVLYLLYELYNFIKGTAGINIFIGIIAVYLIWKLVIYLGMPMLGEILGQFISVGVIAIIIVFQQEIRKFLLLLGNPRFINKTRRRFLFWRFSILQDTVLDLTPVVKAAKYLSASNTGALIVLTRKNEMEDIVLNGVKLDAFISEQLLENLFFKNSPLHDGAVIISENRIVAAKCILPVTEKENLPEGAGLRHRAAVGISEVSDAVVVIVSEQTGKISLAMEGQLHSFEKIIEFTAFLEQQFAASGKK